MNTWNIYHKCKLMLKITVCFSICTRIQLVFLTLHTKTFELLVKMETSISEDEVQLSLKENRGQSLKR